MSLEKIVHIGNIYFIIFAIINVIIPWGFHWSKTTESNPVSNTRIYLYMANIMLIFICLFFGISGFFYTTELFSTSLGLFLLISRTSFWILITFLFVLLKGLKSTISILIFLHMLICIFIHFIPIIYFNMHYIV